LSAEPRSEQWPAGCGRIVLDGVDSTNAEAARIAADQTGPVWILAHRQTAAHGRRGRPWAMAPGNFAATLLMRPEGPPERAALRSFVAALAVHDALAAALGTRAGLALKWPNDLLLNGGKVAGILLESLGTGRAVAHLAVGIGVNLAAAPSAAEVEPGATPPASVLGETGVALAPEAFLDRLAPAFAAWEGQLAAFGFAPVRNAWLARAARLGERVVARTGRATHEGTFETIDDSGALVLRTAQGRLSVPAAEVHF
jgi:BirA family biotin operon repressor/biotin-[acetyl-CoA-carboxylase] ligase